MFKQIFSVALLLGTTFVSTQVQAQQSFPWRSSVKANQPRTRVLRTQRAQRKAPALVAFKQDPVVEKAKQEAGKTVLGDVQPSVSDLPAPQASPVPTAPSKRTPITFQDPVAAPLGTPQQPLLYSDSQIVGTYETPAPALSVVSNATTATPNYCGRNCRKSCCNLGCEQRLFGQTCNGLEIGGWTTLGYHNRNTPLVNNREGEFNLHQAWLYLDKAASRDAGWSLGYRADILYGLDAQDLQAFGNSPTGAPTGFDNSWDNGSFGWALPQAYVQLANYDWDIKIGKFFSPFGYEVIGAPDNFFYSHSYTSYNTEPFTMTGVLGERTINESQSYLLGFTAGWNTGFENNSGGSLIVGTRRRLNEFVDSAFTASFGDSGYRDSGVMTSSVTRFQLTGDTRYIFQADSLHLRDNQEFGIVQYLIRDINPCLALGARLEWWKTDRLFGGPTRSTYDFTMGANYKLNANLMVRPELRFDWGAAAIDPGTPILGIDAVLTF